MRHIVDKLNGKESRNASSQIFVVSLKCLATVSLGLSKGSKHPDAEQQFYDTASDYIDRPEGKGQSNEQLQAMGPGWTRFQPVGLHFLSGKG
jgi:hypothetical protein